MRGEAKDHVVARFIVCIEDGEIESVLTIAFGRFSRDVYDDFRYHRGETYGILCKFAAVYTLVLIVVTQGLTLVQLEDGRLLLSSTTMTGALVV